MAEIIKAFEIIGTIAFAVSGALVAIYASLDIFGVIFVGCITAFGGGIIRDILLGIYPPSVFSNLPMVVLAMITSALVFLFAYVNKEKFVALKGKIEQANNIFDALGLSVFTVIGSEIGYLQGFSDNGFIIVAVGMLTGVGGGIIRDIMTDTTPYVFKKHIYALATIFGSITYFVMRKYTDNVSLVSLVSMVLVFGIRLLATKYCWSLPKIKFGNK